MLLRSTNNREEKAPEAFFRIDHLGLNEEGDVAMFFRRRRCGFLAKMLMIMLGVNWLTRRESCSEDRAAYRNRARAFRQKLREAAAVWDDESLDHPQEDSTVVQE